jgi:uncharacterized protein involved in exopolysaccharide biosynthesis
MAMLDSSRGQAALEFDNQTLDPIRYFEVLKNRKFYALIPLFVVFTIGFAVAMLWPPTYRSEGKILVESQQIPVDLVRPTVTATATERIMTIEQRVMTRDNLLKIVDKYGMFANQRDSLSRTEILDLMRENTILQPAVIAPQGQPTNLTVAITVGFTDRRPDIATKVANELITLFLDEDARSRTTRATETTKFLAQEADKLKSELALLDQKIRESRQPAPESTLPQLLALKAELAQKSAALSDTHPDVRRLRAQIAALEKVKVPLTSVAARGGADEQLDPLLLQRLGIQQNLETTAQKLAAARRGENLERDQYSERLQVLEQAVAPQKPIKPDRVKIIALSFFAAIMAGFAGIWMIESIDRTIRNSSDLIGVANGQHVVAIPFIVTKSDLSRKKGRLVLLTGVLLATLLAGLIVVHVFVRPLDDLWVIFMNRLMGSWTHG